MVSTATITPVAAYDSFALSVIQVGVGTLPEERGVNYERAGIERLAHLDASLDLADRVKAPDALGDYQEGAMHRRDSEASLLREFQWNVGLVSSGVACNH